MADGHGAGHGDVDVGAVAQGNIERDIARLMNSKTLLIGRSRGASLINLTVDKGYPYNINEPVAIANANGVRYAFQHHFNAGGGRGVEVWYYAGDETGRALAAKISAAIAAAYGIPDRGAKATTYFGFICNTNMTAFIIEWGFVDAPNNSDCSKILADPDKGVRALLDAIGIKETQTSGWKYSNGWGWLRNGYWVYDEWIKNSGQWYYLDKTGTMCEGWHKLKWSGGESWFYFTPTHGYMVTGWLKYDSSWFYLDPETGAMLEGWRYVANNWYYFTPGGSGRMYEGVHKIGGQVYCFDSSGVCRGTVTPLPVSFAG